MHTSHGNPHPPESAVSDPPAIPGTEPNHAHAAAPAAHHKPRGFRLFAPLKVKWETRVGIAAVLSFAIVVSAAVLKKGWISRGDKKDGAGREPEPAARAGDSKPKAADASTAVRPTRPAPSPKPTGRESPTVAIATPRPARPSEPAPPPVQTVAYTDPSSPSRDDATPPAPPLASSPESPPKDVEPVPSPPSLKDIPPDRATASKAGQTGAEDAPPPPLPAGNDPAPAEGPREPATGVSTTATESPDRGAAPPPAPAPARPEGPAADGPRGVDRGGLIAPAAVASPATVAPARVPDLDAPPTPPAPEPAAPAATAGGMIPIPNTGRRRRPVADPPAVQEPTAGATVADRGIEPQPHVVRPGENFWSISQDYYHSGRFYYALWAANRARVPKIDELYVGTTILVPPVESLDRSLIISAPTAAAAPARRPARPATRRDDPAGDRELWLDVGSPSAEPGLIEPAASPAPSRTSPRRRRPTYVVQPRDTLRSIARKTLGDAHRADEIRRLNLDLIDDPADVPVGARLRLPDDATLIR
jgi:nucleoid-associated protein YgaU